MSAQTSHHETAALPTETVEVVVIYNGTPRNAPAAVGRRFIVPDGTPAARPLGRRRSEAHRHPGVRDEPVGILTTGPLPVHHGWLFRRLTDTPS